MVMVAPGSYPAGRALGRGSGFLDAGNVAQLLEDGGRR